jgi:hypothetical protein
VALASENQITSGLSTLRSQVDEQEKECQELRAALAAEVDRSHRYIKALDEVAEIAKPLLVSALSAATHAASYGPMEDRGYAADWEREIIGKVQRVETLTKIGATP